MVENVIVIALCFAADTEKAAIDHVVDQDSGGGQGVFWVRLTVAVFAAIEATGTAFPGGAGRGQFDQSLAFRVGPRRRGECLGQRLDNVVSILQRNDVDEVLPSRRK